MGTDIHFYVERRENGRWVSADKWTLETQYLEEGQEPYLTVGYRDHFYSNRNYDVFAILADVRNGRGFAGVDTGDGFEIIAEPRGLPHDMSPELTREAQGCDHTPSWVTVAELMAFDWTQTTKHRGMVNGPQFHAWEQYPRSQGEGPREYCGDVSGASIKKVSEFKMRELIATLPGEKYWDKKKAAEEQLSDTYCQVEWTTPYYRAARDFLSECLPRLWRLGAPDDVRCVFWFDS